MKKLLYILSLIFIISCKATEGDKDAVTFNNFAGTYYFTSEKDGKTVLEVNCWSKTIDKFELYKSEENYFFSFEGFHAENYQVLNSENEDNKIKLTAVDPNYAGDEELEKQHTKSFTFHKEKPFLIVEEGEATYKLIPEGDKSKYELIPCKEE